MGLTRCPDCKKDVSTLAKSCPHCGRPLEPPSASNETSVAAQPQQSRRKWPWILFGILGMLWLIGFLSNTNQSSHSQSPSVESRTSYSDPSPSTPPVNFEVLDTKPVYKNNRRPSASGTRMDVLVAADTTREQALSLGRYFREKYGSDFIDITIADTAR